MTGQNITYDELHYSDAHIYMHSGTPYSGVAENFYESGALFARFRFRDGKEHGDWEEYFESGRQRSVTPYKDGSVHGKSIQWFESGAIQLKRKNEFGIMLTMKEFDENGVLVNEYVRPNDDNMMEYVNQRRVADRNTKTNR